MKKILAILVIPVLMILIFISISKPFDGSATLDEVGCFFNDNLLIEMGGTVFSLPRKKISSLKGPDEQWSGEPDISSRLDGGRICQRQGESPLKLNQIRLRFNPQNCKNIAKDAYGICAHFHGVLFYDETEQKPQEIIRQESADKCINDPYFSTCEHQVSYGQITYSFQYNYPKYPVSDLEYTEQLIVEYLKAHEIISSENIVAKSDYTGCYASDKLRIQFGNTVMELPRRNITKPKGPDVQWEGEPVYSLPLDGDDLCQRETDPPLRFDQIGFSFIPKKCKKIAINRGLCTRFSGWMYDLKDTDVSQEARRKTNTEKCKKKSYFNTCYHSVIHKDVGYYFMFYLRKYPLEDIEYTEEIILDFLKSHEIMDAQK